MHVILNAASDLVEKLVLGFKVTQVYNINVRPYFTIQVPN